MLAVRIALLIAIWTLLYLAVRYLYRKGTELFKSSFSTEAPVEDPFGGRGSGRALLATKKIGSLPRIQIRCLGRRFILIASIVAIFSLASDWAKFFVFEKSGIDVGVMFLISLWLYPFVAALFNLKIRKNIGMSLAFLNFWIAALTIVQISNKRVLGLFEVSAELGAWTYLAASVFLWVGISGYCGDVADKKGENISADPRRKPPY